MELSHMLENTACSRHRFGLFRQYQRHLFAADRQLRQPPLRQVGIGQALDAVVVRIALAQLNFEHIKAALIFVEGKNDRKCHYRTASLGARTSANRGASSSNARCTPFAAKLIAWYHPHNINRSRISSSASSSATRSHSPSSIRD